MNSDSNMKHHPHRNYTARQAMTLIELLVVISIIGVLAGMLLPALANVRKKAKVVQCQKDMADLKGSINVYQHDYNRLPASTPAATVVNAAGQRSDFTYGTTGTGYGTNVVNNNNVGYQASNAELMVILTGGITNGWVGVPIDPTVRNDARNPRKNQYFNAKPAPYGTGDTAGPGLANDGVFRDPWGNPYIVALDVTFDGSVSNSVYNDNTVNSAGTGLVRLGAVASSTWAAKDSVMIFSFGPDGRFAPSSATAAVAANVDPNKDNVLSWK